MSRAVRSRLRLLAAALSALSLLAACHQGAPRRPGEFSSASLFSNLSHAVYAARSEVQSMDLVDECTVRIHWDDGAERTYDLMRLRPVFPRDGEGDGDRYGLLVQRRGQGLDRMLLSTSHWGQYMMARASLAHLRGLCADSRTTADREPDALPG